jgi:hypothetical protein
MSCQAILYNWKRGNCEMMRACFADNADLPLSCNHDTGETWNCVPATEGIAKHDCPYWQPQRAIELVRIILGDSGYIVKAKGAKCISE